LLRNLQHCFVKMRVDCSRYGIQKDSFLLDTQHTRTIAGTKNIYSALRYVAANVLCRSASKLPHLHVLFDFSCFRSALPQHAIRWQQQEQRHIQPKYSGRGHTIGAVFRQIGLEERDRPVGKDDVPQLPCQKFGKQNGEWQECIFVKKRIRIICRYFIYFKNIITRVLWFF